MYGLSTVWGRGAWDVGRGTWGVGRGICRQDASERDFVFTVNEAGRQRQIPQSVYNLWPLKLRLKRARREQPSGATRQDKGKKRKGGEAQGNLSSNVAGISMLQKVERATR